MHCHDFLYVQTPESSQFQCVPQFDFSSLPPFVELLSEQHLDASSPSFITSSDRHLHACGRVCRRCCCKANKNCQKLTAELRQRFTDHFGDDARSDPIGLPTVLCSTCASQLRRLASGNGPKTVIPQHQFRVQPTNTSTANRDCDSTCDICREAFSALNRLCDGRKNHPKRGGTKRRVEDDGADPLCAKCFTPLVGSGHHVCTKRVAVANVEPLLVSIGIDGHLAARAIDRRTSGSSAVLPRFGRPKEVFVKPPAKPDGGMDLLLAIKASKPGTSDSQVSRIRKLVSSFVTTPSVDKLKRLREDVCGDLFEAVQLPLRRGKKYDTTTTPTWVIRCTDVCALIERWHPDEIGKRMWVKLGVDMGQGLLKVTIELMNLRSNSTSALLIVAITPAPECTETLRSLIRSDSMDRLFRWHDVFPCGDMKVMHLLTGTMMNGVCSCPLCVWRKASGLNCVEADLRTMARMQKDYNDLAAEMQKSGHSPKELAKEFFSQEGPPVFVDDFDVPRRLSPPALHIAIGIVSNLHTTLTTKLMNDDERAAHEAALKRVGVQRSAYFANTFEGRHAKKLLWNLDRLELTPNEDCVPIYNALVAFAAVEKSCFRTLRTPDFIEKIQEFRVAYKAAAATAPTLPPKGHLLDKHVVPFLLQFHDPPYGLGFFSEQALESSHGKLKSTLTNWNVKERTAGYEKALRSAVLDFNVERMGLQYADILSDAMKAVNTCPIPDPEES